MAALNENRNTQSASCKILIRDPSPADEEVWRHLWVGYMTFYETKVPEPVTKRTWQRILDPTSPMFARLSVEESKIIGFSVSVLHEGTWAIAPMCYLEDLFVDPEQRGRGAGRLLIQDLIDRAKSRGWSRLYWHTHANNSARRLYDKFAKVDDFVRYRLLFSEYVSD